VAFTWEIYGDVDAHYDDCFAMFNPIGKRAHDDVVERWVAAAVTLVPLLRHHPDVPAMVGGERAAPTKKPPAADAAAER